jgi:hypothetical protein
LDEDLSSIITINNYISPYMVQQKKRHHFIPKAYLNAFCDPKGRVLVYRKDEPKKALHLVPDATQFRGYYYSQPTPAGAQDNNTLEDLFSTIESQWPETVEKLHRREDANERLENIYEFMSLQRVRVPASRDLSEAILARTVKDTMQNMLATGKLPPPPASLKDFPNQVNVAIDPHQSIHAMVAMLQGMAKLYARLGFAAVHNETKQSFLTSDNPVLWFDPLLPFHEQRPYTANPNGTMFLFFPISPRLALIGSTEYQETFRRYGMLHNDVPDENWVEAMNAQVCRFGYEAIIASCTGQEELITRYADISPVHEAISLPTSQGIATIHQQVFGKRKLKPKWKKQ